MIEHGIGTTRAHYWVHLFPLLRRVFWYRVAHCRAYIEFYKPALKIGYSKDGAPTGAGFLIPQSAYFVQSIDVPERYVAAADWTSLTDRESGLRGQEIAHVLIEHRIVTFAPWLALEASSRLEQLDAIDCKMKWGQQRTIEFKTELCTTANLFVQKAEGGHRVHRTRAGEQRPSDFPQMFEGK